MTLLDEVMEFILNNTFITDRKWGLSLAVSLVSTFSYNAYLPTKNGLLKPNTWLVYIGPSGISFKTLPVRTIIIPLLREYRKDLLLPSNFTMEGMVEYLRTISNRGIIIRDEITTLFKDLEKSYGLDSLEFLTQLHDGFIQKRYTRTYKLEEVDNCYVTFIGTTTEYIYEVMPWEFLTQGLGMRFFYVLWSGRKPQIDSIEDLVIWDEPKLESLYQKLEKCTKIQKVIPVSDSLVSYINECYDLAFSLYTKGKLLESTYTARMVEKCIKLSTICVISDYYDRNNPEPPLKDEHVEWSIQLLKEYYKDYKKLVDKFLSQNKPTFKLTPYDDVYRIIKLNKRISRSELLTKTGMKAEELNEIIELLTKEGLVKVVVKKDGRTKTTYYELCE